MSRLLGGGGGGGRRGGGDGGAGPGGAAHRAAACGYSLPTRSLVSSTSLFAHSVPVYPYTLAASSSHYATEEVDEKAASAYGYTIREQWPCPKEEAASAYGYTTREQ